MHPLIIRHASAQPPVRALIFDMDGTIVDTRAYHMAAWRQFVKQSGFSEDYYLVAERGFGKTNWAIFDTWFGAHRNGHDYDAMSEEKERVFRELIKGRERPRPGFIELVQRARRMGIRIGLTTSGPRANAEFLLKDLGIDVYFDASVYGSAAIRSKPHPEPFVRTAALLGVAPQQSVVFEDSVHGLLAARRAQMRLVAIAERRQDLTPLRKWTPHVVQDFRPVVKLLEGWSKP